ncbi:MAG: hypothetical protein IJT81_07935 [Lachnospiraceae bacterium]|nr:hypothetical protein [Lachnospiraceae bacterium]
MQQIVEGMIAMIFLMLFLVTGIDLIRVEVDCCNAREFRNTVIMAMENSEFDEGVIRECFNKAKENGYTLTVTFHYLDGERATVSDGRFYNKQKTILIAEVKLEYKLVVPILRSEIIKKTEAVTC